MFFICLKTDKSARRGRKGDDDEKLAIFGDRRGRRGSELKVMVAIEHRLPGHLTKHMRPGPTDEDEWGTDVKELKMEEMSWALGKKGATRKKLARASGAIVEYVGNFVHIAGSPEVSAPECRTRSGRSARSRAPAASEWPRVIWVAAAARGGWDGGACGRGRTTRQRAEGGGALGPHAHGNVARHLEVTWSIHRDNEVLDWVGRASDRKCHHLPRRDGNNIVFSSLMEDIFTHLEPFGLEQTQYR